MTNEIATSLKSIINNNAELIELNQADPGWKKKIDWAINQNSEPIYLVFPQNIDILATIIRQAFQEQWRILICGGGTKLNWGNPCQNIQLVVSTQKCDRLIEHAIGDFTVTVEAGMKLADLQNILRSHNQFLPIDPSYPNTATLGGIVATADTGSLRERYGSVRDLLLGLSFVRADGAIAKAGGRVVKNVAGYDLMKLFTGAYGTLGIISQLTFRTYPVITTSQTIVLTGNADNIAQACQTIRNSGLTPTALDTVSNAVVKQLGLGDNIGLIARWQTIAESTAQQIAEVKTIATKLELETFDYQDQAEINLWQKCTAFTSLSDSDTGILCKIGIAPTAAVNFLQLKEVTHGDIAVRIHSSSGIGNLQLNSTDTQIITKMRSYCEENQGFLTILNAPKSTKQELDVWGYTGNAIQSMQTIKNQFDPQNILNCDRFIV